MVLKLALVVPITFPMLVSCSGPPPSPEPAPLVRATTPPSSADVDGSGIDDADPEQRAADAIAAYRHNWDVLNQAYAESSVVGLHRVASGPMLYGISDDILYGVHYGLVLEGGMTHHPTLESITEDRAVIIDCALTTNEYRDALSGELLNEDTFWRELRFEMVLEDDVWKLHDGSLVSDDCEPPTPQV